MRDLAFFLLGATSAFAGMSGLIWWFFVGVERAHDAHMADMKDEARL